MITTSFLLLVYGIFLTEMASLPPTNTTLHSTASLPRIYPPFGREMREKEFMFAPGFVNFNHGSYGSSPREVIEARRRFEDQCEARPDVYFRGGYQEVLLKARQRLAEYLKAKEEDLVFVENASSGVNAVLRSAKLAVGDMVLVLSTAYTMVTNTLQWLSDFEGIQVVVVTVVFPGKRQPPIGLHGSLLESIETALIENQGKIKMAVISHIVSVPPIILPVKEIATLLKRYGVSVLIDGAHALGNIPVDIPSLEASGVDYWIGNGHKWLYSPKGSAVLWINKSKQTSVVPTVISSSFLFSNSREADPFLNNFQYTGTRDYTPLLTMSAALDFRTSVGEDKIMAYNTKLALWSEDYLATLWGTEVLLPDELTGMMGCVRLPVQVTDEQKMVWLLQQLLSRYDYQVSALPLYNVVTEERTYWLRLSAQIYLEESDFVNLGKYVLELLKEKSN